ncbi:MAG TPA: DUF5916 domain-containing protein [Gemmatimonadales bacterium]|nr:DUF5916 domain-containing protein [Gemmatimonadales bacterium]
MLTTFLLALQAAYPVPVAALPPASRVYSGRAGEIEVRAPRIEADIAVDGRLDEPVWLEAVRLTDFSRFAPVDGVPAEDSTEVLVWYSPTAIHFGIRASEPHGAVHATLADRDRIFADDFVEILIGTFNDGRQATVLAVNPLGVQMDGAMVERGATSTGFGGANVSREGTDLSPDFTWQSKGEVHAGGYVIEVRIPFKTLRFQPSREQTWTLNVVRRTQHSGSQDSWTPARRAATSFLAQSGRLTGLTDLRRGLVIDVNPEVTANRSGAPGTAGYDYTGGNPQFGGNARWGITNNLNLNASFNPDFSQVESDAGQLGFDPRQALFFPERRPFFLDGIEQFTTPNQLIYSRRIVQPVAAAKLTGTAFGTNIGVLSAVDDDANSATGDHPVYNIVRLQKDVGGSSRIGLAYTDRVEGGNYNRVAGVDGRIVLGGGYSSAFQLAGSRTRTGDGTNTAPLWLARFDRNGRTFGWRTLFSGIADDFRAGSGFIPRPGIVRANITPYRTFNGRPGALLETLTAGIVLDGTWQYRKFTAGEGIQDQKLHVNLNGALRGGWNLAAGYYLEKFGYDEGLYANYYLGIPDGAGGTTFVPFTGQPTIPNSDVYVNVQTPTFRAFNASAFLLYGHDENFPEWASGELFILNASVSVRPSDKLRLDLTYNWQEVDRRTDGSTVLVGKIPRARVEYQLSRPLFVRLVGEYAMERQDSLRDESRTQHPIYYGDGAGGFTRAAGFERNTFRLDFLFAFRPTPGTVVYAGYGSTMTEPESFRFERLQRTRDAFFAKVSYLFHL